MNEHIRGLSKNKIKYIKSLSNKKQRDQYNCFVAEGSKLVGDLCEEILPQLLVCTEDWFNTKQPKLHNTEVIISNIQEIKQISSLKNPPTVLGVFPKRESRYSIEQLSLNNILILDGIQDPGNLGTIIRTANWFGIENIICSTDTVDIYNSKVVQSSMGAISHVNLHYSYLPEIIQELKSLEIPVYGMFMNGDNIYNTKWQSPSAAFIVGNEGKGISKEVESLISLRITIPYSQHILVPESLNVSSAVSVLCSEIFRKSICH